MAISLRPYLGATPFTGGTTFRVWAPFAGNVCVAGPFNQWAGTATPLASEGNGYWSADVPGVGVGDQYKFVVTNADSGTALWRNDPYAREMTGSNGNSVIAETAFTWTSRGYSTPPWNETVIYELHVGSFSYDPASPGGRGTFDAVIAKLDYLGALGVNAIEVMAAGEFASDHSWGYNQSYMFAIENLYGGPNGFRRLVDEAHTRGIAVLFDVVYNHIGPSDNDLWQFDGWGEDGHGGIYFYNDWRRFTPWGETRPDYGREQVRQYCRDNASRWLGQRFVDGLRWDATGWIRNVYGNDADPAHDIPDGWSLMQSINGAIRAEQPWKMSIAEDMQDNEWLTKTVPDGGAGFTAQWAAGFVHPVRRAVIVEGDDERDMFAVRDAIAQRFNGDAFQRVIYTESHDEVGKINGQTRVPDAIWPGNGGSYFSRKRSTLGAALVFTAPGIPMIFQGQEFLEYSAFDDGVELDWQKLQSFGGIQQLYRDLIRLRRNTFGTTRGLCGQGLHVHHVNQADKVIGYHRWDRGGYGDDVVVLANFANRSYERYTLGMPRPGFWRVRFNSDWRGYSLDFADTPGYDTTADGDATDEMPCSATLGVGPYSVLILSQ